MANPTAAASANKTGKPRKKAESASSGQTRASKASVAQTIAGHADAAQATAEQASVVQANEAQAITAQVTPPPTLFQGDLKADLEPVSEFGMGVTSEPTSGSHAEKAIGQTLMRQKSGQTRKTNTKSSSKDLGQKPGHKEAMASGRKTAASSASKPKAASALGSVSDQTPAFNNEKGTLVLTNCTSSPRGIAFKTGIVILQPREMRLVPDEQQQEVRELFKNPTFQRFVDHGIFRLSSIGDDEQSTVVKTPAPPEALTQEVCLNELQMSIGTSTGSRATSPKVVAYQQGGALPETNNNTGVAPEIN